MDRINKRFLFFALAAVISFPLFAQNETDFGANFGVGISKKIGKRFEVGLEEELRTKNNVSSIDRLNTGVDASFSVIRKILKIGVGYTLIADWQDQEEYFDFRHRFNGQANVKYEISRFSFALRSRYQVTYRDESGKKYKWNPKNYWRNRLSVSYKVPKIALTPFLSCEIFYQTNNYKGNVIDKLRYEVGMEYKFDKRNALELTCRYDNEINIKEPQNRVSVGLYYKYSF